MPPKNKGRNKPVLCLCFKLGFASSKCSIFLFGKRASLAGLTNLLFSNKFLSSGMMVLALKGRFTALGFFFSVTPYFDGVWSV